MMSRRENVQSEDGQDCDIFENLREGLLWLESEGKRITGEVSNGQITQTSWREAVIGSVAAYSHDLSRVVI